MKIAEWILEQGIPFASLSVGVDPKAPDRYKIFNKVTGDTLGFKCFVHDTDRTSALLDWLDTERPLYLITLDEKTYLRNIIVPFVKQGLNVTITKYLSTQNSECIIITFADKNSITSLPFPDFKVGTRYIGMKRGHEYTPEELGL